jgi:hypothetical protein
LVLKNQKLSDFFDLLNGFSVFSLVFHQLFFRSDKYSLYLLLFCVRAKTKEKINLQTKGQTNLYEKHRNQRAGKSCVEREAACKPKGRHPLQTQKPSSQVFKQYTGTEEPQNSSHCHTGAEEQPQAVVLPSPTRTEEQPTFPFSFFFRL